MGIITSVVGSVVTFVVGLLIGGLGIYVGGRLIADEDDVWKALWTALFASLGWALVTLFVGWIPFLGGLLALALGLVVYLGVINVQYDGGWGNAALIALIAWVTSAAVRLLIPVV